MVLALLDPEGIKCAGRNRDLFVGGDSHRDGRCIALAVTADEGNGIRDLVADLEWPYRFQVEAAGEGLALRVDRADQTPMNAQRLGPAVRGAAELADIAGLPGRGDGPVKRAALVGELSPSGRAFELRGLRGGRAHDRGCD